MKIVHKGIARGLRAAINSSVAVARGEYLMKIDAHCMVSPGYDTEIVNTLKPNPNWVVIPRRKRLDAANWEIQDVGKPDVDYEFLSYPVDPADFGGKGLNGRIWTDRIRERLDKPEYDIDDNMSFQGSCWCMTKQYFYELELMDEEHYGTFWNEAQEIGLKSWLSGGRVITNKKVWYAHLHKGRTYGRGYHLDATQLPIGAEYTKTWIQNKAWPKQTVDFEWLIEHFWPLPGWSENWREEIGHIKLHQE